MLRKFKHLRKILYKLFHELYFYSDIKLPLILQQKQNNIELIGDFGPMVSWGTLFVVVCSRDYLIVYPQLDLYGKNLSIRNYSILLLMTNIKTFSLKWRKGNCYLDGLCLMEVYYATTEKMTFGSFWLPLAPHDELKN